MARTKNINYAKKVVVVGADVVKEPEPVELKPKAGPKPNPIQGFEPRRYACSRWPFLRLGAGIQFNRGFLIADSQSVIDRVERADGYGSAIIEIKERKGRALSVEESAEIAAIEEIEKSYPKARSGAVSTKDFTG